jgi:transcriptional regulator with XRE-family HTH domain
LGINKFVGSFPDREMKDQENITPIEQHVIDYIFKLRTRRKMSQRDIAKVLGVNGSFVAAVESKRNSAKYNLRHINILAGYFKLSPKDFSPAAPIRKSKLNAELSE